MSDYSLYLPFDDKSESFVLGFEAGEVFQQMKQDPVIEKTVHTKNLPLFRKMAMRKGFSFKHEETIEAEWKYITLTKG